MSERPAARCETIENVGLQQSFPSAFGMLSCSLLLPPSRKYDFHLAGARVDDGNQLFDRNITETAKLWRQFFGFGKPSGTPAPSHSIVKRATRSGGLKYTEN